MPEVNFSHLLRNRTVGSTVTPKALAKGQYPSVITSWRYDTWGRNSTPSIRFDLSFRGWPPGVDADDRNESDGTPIDLTTRTAFCRLAITDAALPRFDRFLQSIGQRGVDMEVALANSVGAEVLSDVDHYTDPQTGELRNQVNSIVGTVLL